MSARRAAAAWRPPRSGARPPLVPGLGAHGLHPWAKGLPAGRPTPRSTTVCRDAERHGGGQRPAGRQGARVRMKGGEGRGVKRAPDSPPCTAPTPRPPARPSPTSCAALRTRWGPRRRRRRQGVGARAAGAGRERRRRGGGRGGRMAAPPATPSRLRRLDLGSLERPLSRLPGWEPAQPGGVAADALSPSAPRRRPARPAPAARAPTPWRRWRRRGPHRVLNAAQPVGPGLAGGRGGSGKGESGAHAQPPFAPPFSSLSPPLRPHTRAPGRWPPPRRGAPRPAAWC